MYAYGLSLDLWWSEELGGEGSVESQSIVLTMENGTDRLLLEDNASRFRGEAIEYYLKEGSVQKQYLINQTHTGFVLLEDNVSCLLDEANAYVVEGDYDYILKEDSTSYLLIG